MKTEKIENGNSLVVFTDDIEDALMAASTELGTNELAEIEDYHTFFNGDTPEEVRVIVTRESKWFPKHMK